MKKTLLMAFIAALIFASCNPSSNSETKTEVAHHDDHDHSHADHDHAKDKGDYELTEVTKSDAAAPVLDAYFAIKKALQEDNQAEAAKAGEALTASLSNLSGSGSSEVKEIIEVIKEHGEHIAKSDITHQREHFEPLGHDMKDLIKNVGADREIYEQYCPMYNDNKGGMWLSNQEELLNPLFGSSMLKCGTTKQKISPQG
ncbi:DUF3347 domain-containing protein [Sphingobacterium sp. UT-1RO-CII-1]|uniref:DUF3347 domain-containing protein n=1 Tax=Sphingobacterium sp. UT-1RO-CII-1 TaxID=2995225 RepID=UPI00227C1AB1|nr:DUF3347 domain-containing protein [Sphingobacterium sp. UT-1RO-CII-1]MCY4781508.1 DUF3347 domain-containing protein [Sphingobacterium sp. UT-1RO-CII-1]